MTEQSGYERSKDKVLFKEAIKSEKRFLNLELYSYDNGPEKIRIKPVSQNTNPNADPNKKWINQKAISGITVQEANGLIKALQAAIRKM